MLTLLIKESQFDYYNDVLKSAKPTSSPKQKCPPVETAGHD